MIWHKCDLQESAGIVMSSDGHCFRVVWIGVPEGRRRKTASSILTKWVVDIFSAVLFIHTLAFMKLLEMDGENILLFCYML